MCVCLSTRPQCHSWSCDPLASLWPVIPPTHQGITVPGGLHHTPSLLPPLALPFFPCCVSWVPVITGLPLKWWSLRTRLCPTQTHSGDANLPSENMALEPLLVSPLLLPALAPIYTLFPTPVIFLRRPCMFAFLPSVHELPALKSLPLFLIFQIPHVLSPTQRLPPP